MTPPRPSGTTERGQACWPVLPHSFAGQARREFFSTSGQPPPSSILEMELVAELTIREDTQDEETLDLDALVEEHKRMVYRIAYSLLRNHHDAEDAAQETFLRVWRAAGKLARVTDPKAWVARIAWNVATDRVRGQQPRAALDVEQLADAVARQHGRGANAEEIAAGAELQRLLEALVSGLPPKLRRVLVLSTVEELDSAEVGRILGLGPAAVRTRLFQARQLLREKLDRLVGKKS